MSDPYIGEIRLFGGSFEPAGWAFCDGRLLPIAENDVLFNLIGTTYGGDGQETFALPDLRGRVPIHYGQGPGLSNNYVLAELGGVESVTLTTQQIPIHNHPVGAANGATGTTPAGAVPAAVTAGARYYSGTPSATAPMTPSGVSGGNQPHENMAPFLCVSFIICLFGGTFPSQT
jgi:microcystin-dependent protein